MKTDERLTEIMHL